MPSHLAYTSVFCATGAFASVWQSGIELAWTIRQSQPSSPALATTASFLRTAAPVLTARASWRFLVFGELMRARRLQRERAPGSSLSAVPRWVDIALSGAGAGFTEVFAAQATSAVLNRLSKGDAVKFLPSPAAVAAHAGRLLFGFGTYGFLSTNFAKEQPPKPFVLCWAMGLAAGAMGAGVVSAIEGIRGSKLWLHVIPRGALGVGTLIAVQVTTCDFVLKQLSEREMMKH